MQKCCMCGQPAPDRRLNSRSPNKPQPAIHAIRSEGKRFTIRTMETQPDGSEVPVDICRTCAESRINRIAEIMVGKVVVHGDDIFNTGTEAGLTGTEGR